MSLGFMDHLEKLDPGSTRRGAYIVQHYRANDCAMCDIFDVLWNREGKSDGELQWSMEKLHYSINKKEQGGRIVPRIELASQCAGVDSMPRIRLSPTQSYSWESALKIPESQSSDENSVNLERVKEWISYCNESHGTNEACMSSSARYPSTVKLRIIDCKTRTVRLIMRNEPYVCLSYVWGGCTANGHALNKRLPPKIPKTIEDAMYVARTIGIPQLWVDQYCINQHDVAMRSTAIHSMGLIYGGAALTIIAANATNASSGLSGIRGTVRGQMRPVVIGSVRYNAYRDVRQEVEASTWNSRGWTYQEGILSRRILVFTETQVYLECGSAQFLEECDVMPGETRKNQSEFGQYDGHNWDCSGHFSIPRIFDKPSTYTSLHYNYQQIRDYFPRHLTFASDTLAAFEGVLDAFVLQDANHVGVKHFYGIPLHGPTTPSLSRGLAWALDHPYPRKPGPLAPVESPVGFPSWTWAYQKAAHPDSENKLLMDFWPPSLLNVSEHLRIQFWRVDNRTPEKNILFRNQKAVWTDFEPRLRVTALMERCTLYMHPLDNELRLSTHEDSTHCVHLDEDGPWVGREVTLLYLGTFHGETLDVPSPDTENSRSQTVALLLYPAGTTGAYRRIGLVNTVYFGELERGEVATVHIV